MISDLKPYPLMKDSGVPWLGEVPVHWGTVPLCTVAQPKSIINCSDRDLLSVYLNRGVIKFSEVEQKRTNATSNDLSKYQAVDPGDFVLNNQQAWRGSIGVSQYCGIVSPAYIVLSLTSTLNSQFANYLFRDRALVSQYLICSKGVGSIQRNLYWPHLKRVMVLTPPLGEQVKVARFLDFMNQRIRRCIRSKQKLIKLLEEQKQVIIHYAVTRGLDHNVRLKPSGVEWLGDVPEHWEARKLGTIGIFFKGRGISKSDITETGAPAITYGEIYTHYDVEAKVLSKCTSPEVAANAQEILKGDLLFTASGETIDEIGKTTLYSGDGPGYAGGDIIILRLKEGNGLYLSYTLNSSVGVQQKSAFGRGDIIVHISASKLKQITVPIPPHDEQIAITKFLEQAMANIAKAVEHNRREIDLLREYRTRLIADVVTGKLDVREAAANLPDETEETEALDEIETDVDGKDMMEGGDDISELQEAEV